MAVWRAFGRIAGYTVRVMALVALLLGLFPTQEAPVHGLSAREVEAANLPAIQQEGPPYVYYFPLVFASRDDLMMAESNLQIAAVSAGYGHACAIRPGGEPVCWGLNDHGQATPVPGSYTQISAGGNTTCGLHTDGTLVCWGDDTYGQAAVPAGTYTQVSVGGTHTCAIRSDGTLACWGSDALGQLRNLPSGTFTQVASGNLHTCAIRSDGALACWGSDNYGQAEPPSGAFTQVSAGGFHSCAVNASGALSCWGYNAAGQTTVPLGSYSQVAAGFLHTCAIRTDGSLACWGSNGYGQLTNIPEGEFQQVSTSSNHTCAIRTTGTLACWGWNRYGQSFPPSGVEVSVGEAHTCTLLPDGLVSCWGDNTFGQSTPPAGAFLHVSAGSQHTCGLDVEGKLACWGNNSAGQSTAPAGTFLDVSAGGSHACALDLDGNVICWGQNTAGQVNAPAGTFTRLDAGLQHTCALQLDGSLACWGNNTSGESTPPAGTFTQVSAGGRHSCALNVQGQVSCWGDNAAGQTTVPIGTFAQVSAGLAHTCAVSAQGLLSCWGDNSYGQSSPPSGTFAQVSAGARTSCAVRLDGSVTCWGGNPTPTILISPDTLPDATQGQAYSQTFTASGGTAPYTFTISAGSLPAGIQLTEAGLLSGTPQAEGTYTFTVQASDSSSPFYTGERQYTLTVKLPGDTTPPVITSQVRGTLGNNGWYVSSVAVTWEVTDPESAINGSNGCDAVTLSADTTGQTLTCTATSAGGTSSASVTVKIDRTPPANVQAVPARPADHNGWYKRPVDILFTGTDAISGISSCSKVTYSGPDSANAQVSGTCTDNAGNTSAPVIFTLKYDSTAPAISAVVQPNPVYLHGSAQVIPNASDALSGLDAVACGNVDTSSVGLKSVQCTARDLAGNQSTVDVPYNVIYRFEGFLPPVENPPALNTVVAGQTVPFKFRLSDANGAPVTDLTYFKFDYPVVGCPGSTSAVNLAEIYQQDVPFNQGGGLYHYNWQTSKSWSGLCKDVRIDLGEGPGFEHEALFWFRK